MVVVVVVFLIYFIYIYVKDGCRWSGVVDYLLMFVDVLVWVFIDNFVINFCGVFVFLIWEVVFLLLKYLLLVVFDVFLFEVWFVLCLWLNVDCCWGYILIVFWLLNWFSFGMIKFMIFLDFLSLLVYFVFIVLFFIFFLNFLNFRNFRYLVLVV